jgi:Zn-finger nucleic acid-binding protein
MPLLVCPVNNAAMQEVTRNGVTFGVWPQCRGVWLDRGELEKLLSLAQQATKSSRKRSAGTKRAGGKASRASGGDCGSCLRSSGTRAAVRTIWSAEAPAGGA